MAKYGKFVALLLMIILLGACQSKDDDGDKPVDTQVLIGNAAEELNNAESFRLNIQQGGPSPIIAEVIGQTIVFNSAQAIFVSPDRTSATISVSIGDLNEEASVIAVDEVQYINQIFITGGEWCQANFAIGFSPVDLQSSERGLGDALLSIENLEMVGREEIDGGIGVYHLKGSVETERVRSVSVGMISSAEGNSDIDIYIREDETNRLARIIVKEIVAEDETRIWTIDFVGYNQPYSVDEPQELLESCLIS